MLQFLTTKFSTNISTEHARENFRKKLKIPLFKKNSHQIGFIT